MATKVVTLRIPDALFERAVAAAEASNSSSVADFLRQMIVDKLNTRLHADPWIAMEARLLQEFPKLQQAIIDRLNQFDAE